MLYIREFEFIEEKGMMSAEPFGLEGATCGTDLQDAALMAAEWLRVHVLDALAKGEEFPQGTVGHRPQHGGVVIAVAIAADLKDVPAMTATEAARELGLSTAQVVQLCSSGALDSWTVGATRMISRDSVLARKAAASGQTELGTRRHRADG